MKNFKEFYNWYNSLEEVEQKIVDEWGINGLPSKEIAEKYNVSELLVDYLIGYYEKHFKF